MGVGHQLSESRMRVDDMEAAVLEAERTLSNADSVATKLARLLIGRLRKVNSTWVLSSLKRELRDYNIHTESWREK